ncbi:ATP-dependent DNA helicase DinG [Solibacillus sp. FSL R7-0682]|uniref:ATP-dependent DNA helicase DinG n=1 Tax=Solibacillus sp. FSL R7-0682 TaxID=2921690 RepID=UPI0030F9A86A
MNESQTYAIVDIETTGHSPANGDRMIQIAIVLMQDWQIIKTYTTFIHPGKSIPLFIQDLTNITDDDVKDAMPFEAHAEYIFELLQGAVFVAHNTDFDLSFLQAEFKRAGLPKWYGKKIDTVELAKILFPMSLSYKLGDLANDLNIPLESAHRADDDALATAYLLKHCWQQLLSLPLLTIEQLHKRSFRLKTNLAQLFFDVLVVKRAKALDENEHVYFNKIAIRKMAPTPKINSEMLTFPSTTEEKLSLLQKAIVDFEERPKQFQMMDSIWQTLNTKSEHVIEASTGIGKTLGYLVPAIIYAKQTGKKIGVSSYTAHLLDQLLQNEIPTLEQALGQPIKIALLKGMNHYIDLEKFEQLLKSPDDSYDETFTILQTLVWLAKTETGDLNELNVSGGGQLLLDKIRKTTLPKTTMPLYDFYSRAIQNSRQAEIIVTNHAMLLSDLVRNEQIFDSMAGWIIDEAHQFIQAAISHDEKLFTYMNWKYLFGQIGTYEDEQLFYQLRRAALKKHLINMPMLQQIEKRFIQMVQAFDHAIATLYQHVKVAEKNEPKQGQKFAIFISQLNLPMDVFSKVSNVVQQWIDEAHHITQQFTSGVEELAPEHQYLIDQWRYWVREYTMKLAEWDEVFLEKDEHYSCWLELDRRSVPGSIQLFKKPIDVTQTIAKLMNPIREKSSIIWTSGTLTVPNNERFITNQLGIDTSIPIEKLHAPASYYDGAKAIVVTDMPDIQGVSQSDYIEEVAHAVTNTVRMTNGRCFVLFTSQEMLRKTVELIHESELLSDYMIFAQGVTPGSRMRLLKSFQKFNHSVLFGTNSFWEGVDVPGDGLAAVIVVRLPFSSPEEPTFKARSQFIQQQGRNAFTELSLPEAILRFKQGFGRLIRSSHDKGVFIVLDRRIETKSYGHEFIQSLPPISVQKLPLDSMVQQLGNWYNE